MECETSSINFLGSLLKLLAKNGSQVGHVTKRPGINLWYFGYPRIVRDNHLLNSSYAYNDLKNYPLHFRVQETEVLETLWLARFHRL